MTAVAYTPPRNWEACCRASSQPLCPRVPAPLTARPTPTHRLSHPLLGVCPKVRVWGVWAILIKRSDFISNVCVFVYYGLESKLRLCVTCLPHRYILPRFPSCTGWEVGDYGNRLLDEHRSPFRVPYLPFRAGHRHVLYCNRNWATGDALVHLMQRSGGAPFWKNLARGKA